MEERKKVKVITTDLYTPYLQLISKVFLQARIQIMKTTKDSPFVRKLKKHWKLFQKLAVSL